MACFVSSHAFATFMHTIHDRLSTRAGMRKKALKLAVLAFFGVFGFLFEFNLRLNFVFQSVREKG